MSKKDSNTGLGEWLQGLSGGSTIAIGFVMTLVGFVQFWQGNSGLVTLVLLVLGMLLVWLACLYFVRFWRPERQDESPRLILPAPTGKQEKQQQKQEKKRRVIRRLALVGLVLVPLLAMGGGWGWQYVQSLPSDEVVILVADFDGPDTQNNRITETILQQLRQKTQSYDDVRVEALEETVTEQAGSEAARIIAKKRKAAIMIWGWYGVPGEVVPISVNFEVLDPSEYLPNLGDSAGGKIREFAISELSSFQLQTQLSSEISYLTLFTLGVAEYAAEDWDAAISLFNASLENIEESDSLNLSPTFFFKGNAHFLKENFGEASAAYDAALKIKPDYPDALSNKGYALSKLGKYAEAIAAYNTALKIKPELHEALNNKGNALTKYSEVSHWFDQCD